MYGNGMTSTEDMESMMDAMEDYEHDEADESDEADEAARRHRPMKVPMGGSSYKPRPSRYVTQTQLQATVSRLDGRINTLSRMTETQVNSVRKEQSRQATMLKKEVSDRKKETEVLKRDLKQTRELAALLPLISRPSSQTLTSQVGGLAAGTKVLVDKDDSLSLLLPLLLLGGLGGSGSGSSGLGGLGGDDSSLLLIVLLLGLGKR